MWIVKEVPANSFWCFSVKQYEHFKKEYHNVDLGQGYLSSVTCSEMLIFIASVSLEESIVLLLNSSEHHFCLLFYG